ncbi:MAG TPA: TlpA disulfide reductase family protein [Chitinophagaceae bacterium]|nr:TlpA disulfide reductase family protein [Chitinophagaceae bacterium]
MGFLKSWVAVGLAASLYSCSGEATQKTADAPDVTTATPAVQTTPAKEQLPPFAMVDAAGNTVGIQQFRGKKIFVNLWATWCPPCRAEMPSIEKLYSIADTSKVQFVMLSLDKDFETAKKYVQTNHFTAPIFYPAGDLPPLFSVNGIPTTFIFNEQGQLLEQHEGSENYNTATYRKLFGAAK